MVKKLLCVLMAVAMILSSATIAFATEIPDVVSEGEDQYLKLYAPTSTSIKSLSGSTSYKVKTFCEITKLEKDGAFVYESVPGTAVYDMKIEDGEVEFEVEGIDNTQITVGLDADSEYRVILDKETVGFIKTNLGGKLSFSADLNRDKAVKVKLIKM